MAFEHQTEITIYEGETEIILEVTVHYDWQSAESATYESPGCGYEATIFNVTCPTEIFNYERISEETMEDLEKQCYKSMFNNSYDDRD